ncbi:MAG: M23 family metallopeptidase [Tannerella sp.]|jgi:hypothetical protein|nr:M23 family metallopeptidase [Tannerella sp.]
MYHKTFLTVWLASTFIFSVHAQTLRNPLDIPPLLSGNFGELRANHFHSGLDFKTQGEEGKRVYAVRDGYVSRIVVSPWGYGNVVYVSHPVDSLTTVYAHLQRFAAEIADWVREKQYEAERFAVDLTLTPEQFPVDEGDVIGYSGNSGSSGGPHLHFEVRDLATDEPIDPLPFYRERIRDVRPPRVRAVMIHPVEGRGVVNGSAQKREQTPGETLEAWGRIGFSLCANDWMDGTTNVYGVREISMFVDNEEVFHSRTDRFSFDETRYLNAWIDYERWREDRLFFVKMFVEPGNRLRFITGRDRGYLTITEPRVYYVSFLLADAFGNMESVELEITGKEQDIPQPDRRDTTPFFRTEDNHFGAKGIRLFIPAQSLYAHLDFRHTAIRDTTYLSDIHLLHDRPVPLHRPAQLSLFLLSEAQSIAPHQYGIVSLRNGRSSWVGGTYRDGWIDADIRELGVAYAVASDTTPPRITPVAPARWVSNEAIVFRLTDNLSGVETYRGTIDGTYALFEMDGKKSLIKYTFDSRRLSRGKHVLSLTVADACGNTAVYETTFTW